MGKLSAEQRDRILQILQDSADNVRQDDATPVKKVLKFEPFQVGMQYLPGDERHGRKLKMGYGHIRGFKSDDDGMSLDCYVHKGVCDGKCDPTKKPIYAVTQLTQAGDYDEQKYFLGFEYPEDVEAAYKLAMPTDMFGGVEEVTLDDLEEYRVKKDAFPRVLRKMKIGPHTIAITHDPNDFRIPNGVPMRSHYGHLEKSWGYGEDGKALDFYIKPGLVPGDELPPLYRVVQTDPSGGWDESKFFLGWDNPAEARDEHVYHVGMARSGYVEPWEWDSFDGLYESEENEELDLDELLDEDDED